MRNKLALLVFLVLVSIVAAVIANASGCLGLFAQRSEVRIDEVLIFTRVTPEQKTKAVGIALSDPNVQRMLEGEGNYSLDVFAIFDIKNVNVLNTDGGVVLTSKDGLMLVELRILRDYGDEFGVKVVKITVDILKEEVKEMDESPEVRNPKVHEGIIPLAELLSNPSKYQGQIVKVSGVVSDLGLLRRPYFTLDGKVFICYLYNDTDIYPTQIKDKIQNGDPVVVTGKFLGDTIYAEKVEKATG